MIISHRQRKQQGAVFTTNATALVDLERKLGYTADPDGPPYWEDSVGSGDLVVALAIALFEDLADCIPDPDDRLQHIFERRIFMNDIDKTFLTVLQKRLTNLVCKLVNKQVDVVFNIALADTIDPTYDPKIAWGFTNYRTITNRSYQQLSDLSDATTRKLLRQFYQEKVFPGNARVGKRIKVTDCGQFKAVSDPLWEGGTDLRPSNVPVTLQTDDIRTIDYSDTTKTMFMSDSSPKGAGIEVVILQYDRKRKGAPVDVIYNNGKVRSFDEASLAWEFYNELTSHNFSTKETQALVDRLTVACPYTVGTYCNVRTTGATTGNKKQLVGDVAWMRDLIKKYDLEPDAFVKWLDVDSIVPGGICSTQFALLPYSNHPKALGYYKKQIPTDSTHAVPAEKKALPMWQRSSGMVLYARYHPQFNSDLSGLAVGCSFGFGGIGQTGSVLQIEPLSTLQTPNDYMLKMLAILNSSYGNFMKAKKAKQHKAIPTVVALGSSMKNIPIPDLDAPETEKLIEIAEQIIKTKTIHRDRLDQAVYGCMPFVTQVDQQTITEYLRRRTS